MRRLGVVVLLLASIARGEEVPPEQRAYVETIPATTDCFVGQSVRVRLRLGWDGPWFRENAVPLVARPLDVPLLVRAGWANALDGASIRREVPVSGGISFVIGDDVVRGEPVRPAPSRDGRAFDAAELVVRVVPQRVGELVLQAPTMRFAYAEGFREDLIGDVPTKVREVLVRGADAALRVAALPEAGRPADFTGAVGRFTVSATSSAREVALGGSVRLTLTIDGDGETDRFDAPKFQATGFHVLGVLDDKQAARRTVVYEVEPLSEDVREIPAIALATFDPGPPGAWRTERTDALPITVLPGRVRGGAAPSPPPRSEDGAFLVGVWRAVGVLVGLLALILFVVLRRRAAAASRRDPAEERASGAAAAFRADVAGGTDVSDAFAEYVAARLRVAKPSVVGPGLAGRLASAGVPQERADRAAALLERLVAARYGAPSTGDREAAAAMVDELEADFVRPGS